MHLEIPVCIASPGLSLRVICFCYSYPSCFAFGPCRSSFVILYYCFLIHANQPRNLEICFCWIYSVTPLDCSRLRDCCVLKIEKARTRNGRKLGRGRAASPNPPFPFSQSCPHISVCLSLTRHSYCLRGWNQSLDSSSALYCLMKLELLRHLVNNALR